jgi:hypothetical protein
MARKDLNNFTKPWGPLVRGIVDVFSVGSQRGFSWMFDFRDGFVDIFYTNPLIVSDQLHSKSDMQLGVPGVEDAV